MLFLYLLLNKYNKIKIFKNIIIKNDTLISNFIIEFDSTFKLLNIIVVVAKHRKGIIIPFSYIK